VLLGDLLDCGDAPDAQRLRQRLRELNEHAPRITVAANQFLASLDEFLKSGIHILAHPFRVFYRSNITPPKWIYGPVTELLKKHDVAAEINYHTNEPDAEFFSKCIRSGVKLAFGSDSHNLYEIGEFYYHLKLLESCGYKGDPEDILVNELTPSGA